MHRSNDAEKVDFIRHVIYVSTHPIISRWSEEARRGGKHDPKYFQQDFIVNPYAPRHIWYLDLGTGEAIELDFKVLVIRDPDLPYEFSIPDMVDRDRVEAAEGIGLADSRAQKLAVIEAAQREGNESAKLEYEAAAERAGGEPPKTVFRRDKRANREKETADTVFGVPVPMAALQAESPKETGSTPLDSQRSEVVDQVEEDVGAAAGSPSTVVPQSKPRRSLLRAAIAKLNQQ